MSAARYKNQKTAQWKEQTLYLLLDAHSQCFIDNLCSCYHFTFQEFRKLCEVARDLVMWHEGSLEEHWGLIEIGLGEDPSGRERKRLLFAHLLELVEGIKGGENVYPVEGFAGPKRDKLELLSSPSSTPIMGSCPVASEKTVCCNLRTLDAVQNCGYGCSYCTIQTFYGDSVRLDGNLEEKLQSIELNPNQRYHIGTGQSSDSLMWGNRGGLLDALFRFAADNPNVVLEFKTKSANIAYLLEACPSANLFCSWSLNTETIIDNEEHFTASLDKRLEAARKVADKGIKVAFHFHPIVDYHGWREDYLAVARQVLGMFTEREVVFVSFGTLTFIKPVIREIRRRGGSSKILQMPMVKDPHGKLTYPDQLKTELLAALSNAFSPWKGLVYQYLCMERAEIWDSVFGSHYQTNELFETALLDAVWEKLNLKKLPANF